MMKYIRPSFCDKFKCIADKCTYNCCQGWNITIDNETVKKYKTFTGSLGDKVKKYLISDNCGNYSIKLDENKRCPFLTENGLCEIVLKKGSEYLSKTCTFFPHNSNKFTIYSNIVENSLSNACLSVVDFMFKESKIFFSENDLNDIIEYNINDPTSKHNLLASDIRKFFIILLQLRVFPLWIREYFVATLAKKIEPHYKNKDFDAIKEEIKTYDNLSYLTEYADKIINISPNHNLKFNFIITLYNSFGGIYDLNVIKYFDKIKNVLPLISPEKLVKIYEKFDNEIYNDIEYVFENSCVNDLFHNFFAQLKLDQITIYENCMSIFLLHALIKFTMSVYWYANNYNISKIEETEIISIFSRKILHNDNLIIKFCKIYKEVNLFNPSYLFVILR